MSVVIVTVLQNKNSATIPVLPGQSLLSALRDFGCPVNSPCGGNGTCGQCRVLSGGKYISACKFFPVSNCTVSLPDFGQTYVTAVNPLNIEAGGRGLGAAIDIGTTTVAAYLYDLKSGLRAGEYGARNAQFSFGADVISRIKYSSDKEGLNKLSSIIRRQISAAVRAMCTESGHSEKNVSIIAVAGNTVMQHIFSGLSPEGIGIFPYEPLSLFGGNYPAASMFDGMAPDAEIYLCPALSGYVGGDITAGLLGSGAGNEEKICLFADIGTNGEMCIGNKDGFLCCAAAAGPAFEGAGTDCGTDARKGAVNRVYYVNNEIKFDVIGDVKATGICGSGLIDAVAALDRKSVV